jgi:hypothetical protein
MLALGAGSPQPIQIKTVKHAAVLIISKFLIRMISVFQFENRPL